ncbi:MAG: indole-3-glycerol phosphate synthase TrpC [Chloroflexi bacterium]|nr:indole-3-glycerol phosphate synthase TrpC [Chloroflexota bacterium]
MPRDFVQTGTVLDRILERKVAHLAARQASVPEHDLRAAVQDAAPPRDFVGALHGETVALIAEVKHASPSKGVLIEPFDPVALGQTYAASGAAAISVLTDEPFFQGHLDHLAAVRQAVSVPVLRKDFVIDPYQVYEARAAGADAILLIAAALDDAPLADLHALALDLGLAALVEVHNEHELDRALGIGPRLLGINNRNLKTFEVDRGTVARLAPHIPAGITLVAESGIRDAADVRQMAQAGAHAVLVGETLVRAGDPGAAVQALSSQPREER